MHVLENIKMTLDHFENDYAVLKCNNGSEAFLPISILPEIEEGDTLQIQIVAEKQLSLERQRDVHEMLNIILKN